MSASLSHRRSALAIVMLLFLVVLLATASAARADYIYGIDNYSSQNGVVLSGTITTDALGHSMPAISRATISLLPHVPGSAFTMSASDSNYYFYFANLQADSEVVPQRRLWVFFEYPVQKGAVPVLDYQDYYLQNPSDNDFVTSYDLSYNPLFTAWAATGQGAIGYNPMIIASAVPEPANADALGHGHCWDLPGWFIVAGGLPRFDCRPTPGHSPSAVASAFGSG